VSPNRTTLTLIAVVAALGAVTGAASTLTQPPAESAGGTEATATRLPVERSTLVCPQPTTSDLGETTYTGYTPKGDARRESEDKGSAGLLPAESTLEGGGPDEEGEAEGEDSGKETAALSLKEPGTPVTQETESSGTPALTGSADGRLAPGWTVQQTTAIATGTGRGMLGTACSAPGTDFWFTGVSTAEDRHDYIHLTNPDSAPATVDLLLYGKNGRVESDSGSGINVPGGTTVAVLLSTLTAEPVPNVTTEVVARTGRIGAQVQALDEKLGADWISAAADPGGSVVLPGIPADATGIRLTAFAPGEQDADLAVKFAGPSGSISPAGLETLHVKSGMTTAIDLNDLTQGEPGTLVLTPSGSADAPVVAGLRVLRGKGTAQEMAFIPATAPVEERATAAGSEAKGSTLSLVAPDKAAKAEVTASAGSEGGEPVSRTYDLKPGTTITVDDLRPDGGKGHFALTVERISGGAVYAARMLEAGAEGVPTFTVQTLPDDRGSVEVPRSSQDLSVLND
jgi:Family of unknown function (DUF5719)